jgi:CRISPR-associated protein Cst2
MLGRFYSIERTGYRHLDEVRKKLAVDKGLSPYDNGRAYQLDPQTRKQRLSFLLEGLAKISGGAKQAIHYTDISPRFVLLGIAKGGNHLFGTAVGADKEGQPVIKTEVLKEVASVYSNDLLSGFYAGLAKGYLDEQREQVEAQIGQIARSVFKHPVEAIRTLQKDLDVNADTWLA